MGRDLDPSEWRRYLPTGPGSRPAPTCSELQRYDVPRGAGASGRRPQALGPTVRGMRIAVLGPLEVLTDDAGRWRCRARRNACSSLSWPPPLRASVSTDRVVETLWDGDRPATARKSLQAHLVRLRSALEPDRPQGSTGRYVVRRGPGYALAVDRASIDALHIGDLAARGRACSRPGTRPGARGACRPRSACGGASPTRDWPDAAVRRGRAAPADRGPGRRASPALLEAQLALGRHADVLPELERLVAEDPLHEDWWRLLMLALYRGRPAGRRPGRGRAGAGAARRGARRGPGPALRAMEAAILAQDPALDLAVEPTAPRAGRAPPGSPRPARTRGWPPTRPADAALFHGRQRLVPRSWPGWSTRRCSSCPARAGPASPRLVRAGLLPALAAGALPGSETWRPVVVTPGRARSTCWPA